MLTTRPHYASPAEIKRKSAIYNDRTIRGQRSAVIGHRRNQLHDAGMILWVICLFAVIVVR